MAFIPLFPDFGNTKWVQRRKKYEYLLRLKRIKQSINMNVYLKEFHARLFLPSAAHLSFFPPDNSIWIWRPLLNAWLKSRRVWNSMTKGNHAKMATGANITSAIRYSYPLAIPFTDPHNLSFFTVGLHACAI